MTVPQFNMRQLLEAGVHFGHQSHRWNPKMAPFIYGARNNIHILDLTQTVPMLHQALNKVSDTVAGGGRVLFVATKRQASDSIAAVPPNSISTYHARSPCGTAASTSAGNCGHGRCKTTPAGG